MKKTICRILLLSSFKYRRLESLATRFFLRLDGNEIKSEYLRKLYLHFYRIDAELYTYGCFSPSLNFGGGKITIGRYCSIASGVRFLGANHPIDHFSTSAIFYNKSLGYNVKDIQRYDLIIEDDVWIGLNVCITCGCKRIGRGAIVGAGSVVTKDVEPYTIVGGVPAKVIRKRFDDGRIAQLEASKWWKKDPKQLIKEFKSEIYE